VSASTGSVNPEADAGRWIAALEWHTTLSEADGTVLTSGKVRAWQQWYAQADNQLIFDQLSRLLANRGTYPPAPPQGVELELETRSEEYDPSQSIMEWRQAQRGAGTHEAPQPQAPPDRRRYMAPLAFGLAAALALAALIMLRPSWLPMIGGGGRVVYQTGVGQRAEVELRDGSVVTLGGQTRLAVEYTASRRLIRLFGGKAWFQDKNIRNWPFVVNAGGGTITAIGTAFVVNRGSDGVVVMVTAGTVEVSARASMFRMRALGQPSVALLPFPVVRLGRNQELSYGDDGTVGRVTRTDPRAIAAWTRGYLVFEDVPLRDVVENVDRYWSQHILVSPRAGELRFSGLIYEDQVRYWLNGLRRIFPVTVQDGGGAQVCVHTRDSRASPPESACAGPDPWDSTAPPATPSASPFARRSVFKLKYIRSD
jgi:ferric-dicitrate binding protein FerR (iron transport regulator)